MKPKLIQSPCIVRKGQILFRYPRDVYSYGKNFTITRQIFMKSRGIINEVFFYSRFNAPRYSLRSSLFYTYVLVTTEVVAEKLIRTKRDTFESFSFHVCLNRHLVGRVNGPVKHIVYLRQWIYFIQIATKTLVLRKIDDQSYWHIFQNYTILFK